MLVNQRLWVAEEVVALAMVMGIHAAQAKEARDEMTYGDLTRSDSPPFSWKPLL